MKHRLPFLLSLVAFGALVFTLGCNTVSVSSTQYLGIPAYPATVATNVTVLRAPPTTPNVRLGEITVEPQGSPSVQQIEAKLQQAAAKMGANAVVIVADRTMITGAFVSGPWWGRQVSTTTGRVIVGVAIRYTQ
jgi:hypothetical protein